MIECFVKIVTVMANIFRFGPKRKLVDAPLTDKEHLDYRVIYVAFVLRAWNVCEEKVVSFVVFGI